MNQLHCLLLTLSWFALDLKLILYVQDSIFLIMNFPLGLHVDVVNAPFIAPPVWKQYPPLLGKRISDSSPVPIHSMGNLGVTLAVSSSLICIKHHTLVPAIPSPENQMPNLLTLYPCSSNAPLPEYVAPLMLCCLHVYYNYVACLQHRRSIHWQPKWIRTFSFLWFLARTRFYTGVA